MDLMALRYFPGNTSLLHIPAVLLHVRVAVLQSVVHVQVALVVVDVDSAGFGVDLLVALLAADVDCEVTVGSARFDDD